MDPDPGTLTRHLLCEDGRDDNGRYTQVTDTANLFNQRTTRTYSNNRGHPVEVIHAYGTFFAASEFFAYDRDGKLIRHIDPDGATTRHAYNERGERIVTALDLKVEPGEAPDHIDYEVDRIPAPPPSSRPTKTGSTCAASPTKSSPRTVQS